MLMARPSSKTRNQRDPQSFSIPKGYSLEGEFKFKPPEDNLERKHRLRKDFLSFLVKDLMAYLVAFLLIIVAAIHCFSILRNPSLPKDERQWAMSVLASLLAAIAGMIFGKGLK